MSNTHEISVLEWERDKLADNDEEDEDDASYDYEYEYDDEEEACDLEDALPTDIESTKRALRRLSIQMHAVIDSSELVNSEINRRNTWTNKDDMTSKESDPWSTSMRGSTPGTQREVAAAAKAVFPICEASLDDSGYIEEVIDEDEYEDEVIEEEILTDDEDFFDMVVEKKQRDENAVVGEFDGTTIYSEVKQTSFAMRRQAKVTEMETLDERSVETDVDLRSQLDHCQDQSYKSIVTIGNEERLQRPLSEEVQQTNYDSVETNAQKATSEHEDSLEKDHPTSDDDQGNDDEDDDNNDEEDVTPEDVKEAIVYILKQEKPIDKGFLTSEQATRMMALPFADQKEILKHFELCDNAGDPICWDLLVAMSNPEEEHDDESDDDASPDCCSCGHDSNSACLPVGSENGKGSVRDSVDTKKSTDRGCGTEQNECDKKGNEHDEEIQGSGNELDLDDGHVEEETVNEEIVEETEHEEEVEEVVEEDETELDLGSPRSQNDDDHDDNDSSGGGSGSFLSSDDEHEPPEVESLGSGEYSLRADSTNCASSVTYNDNTEVASDEEDNGDEEAQNIYLQAMRRDRKLRQQSKSF